MQLVQDFRDITTGDGTYANVHSIAASVNADPSTVGILACVSTHLHTPPILVPNQAIALEWLSAVDPDGTAHTVHRFTHWACGWIDFVIINTQRAAVVDVCADIMHRLDSYPLLDEARCCSYEWEANHPAPGECYSEEGDACPCHDEGPEACAKCDGIGIVENVGTRNGSPRLESCAECNGTGTIPAANPDEVQDNGYAPCPECEGGAA
jgi:hypothetical protein